MPEQFQKIIDNLTAFGPRRTAIGGGILAFVFAVVIGGSIFLNRPANETLYVGLDRSDVAKIGVVLGDAAHQFLLANGFSDLPAGNLSTAATANHLIRKLYAGRVDLMPMSELNCQFPVDQCSHFVEALKLSEMGNGLYLALRQDSEPALIKKLESAFQSMRQDGSLKSLQAPLQPASQ